jgi:hypothetical protein
MKRPAGFSTQEDGLSSGLPSGDEIRQFQHIAQFRRFVNAADDFSHNVHIGHKDNPMESFVPFVFFVATLTSGE